MNKLWLKTVMNHRDSSSFELRQIFDLTAKEEEGLAICCNLRLSLVCRHN